MCSGEAGISGEGGGVKNILQMLCNKTGIDIEFDDSDDSESDIGEGVCVVWREWDGIVNWNQKG